MSMTKSEFEAIVSIGDCFIKSTLGGADDKVVLVYSTGDEVHLYKGKHHEEEFAKYVRWLEDAKADK